MTTKAPTVLKQNGVPQRSDIALSKDIAIALSRKLLAGEPLFTSEPTIKVTLQGEEGERELEISVKTVNSWVSRNNIVPETGEPLRDILDAARATYRSRQRENRQREMVDEAERKMQRTLRLRTNQPVIGMFGVIKDENGKIVRKENSALLKVQMKTAEYVTERLDPDRYGKVERGEHKHLHFSLADLRRAKEQTA